MNLNNVGKAAMVGSEEDYSNIVGISYDSFGEYVFNVFNLFQGGTFPVNGKLAKFDTTSGKIQWTAVSKIIFSYCLASYARLRFWCSCVVLSCADRDSFHAWSFYTALW